MWLLDKNVPRQMIAFLQSVGVTANHAGDLGWGALRNGVLTRTAYDVGSGTNYSSVRGMCYVAGLH